MPLITQAIDNGRRITLLGNTRPEANPADNVGTVPDDFAMPHMLLQLARSAVQQQQLEQLAADVSNPSSPNYRQFLTGAQFAAAYGPNSQDVQTITGWLSSQGFQVNAVYPIANSIDFSGTAGQVRTAFGTLIHRLNVNGETYVANINDPQIPEALACGFVGIALAMSTYPQAGAVRRSIVPIRWVQKSETENTVFAGRARRDRLAAERFAEADAAVLEPDVAVAIGSADEIAGTVLDRRQSLRERSWALPVALAGLCQVERLMRALVVVYVHRSKARWHSARFAKWRPFSTSVARDNQGETAATIRMRLRRNLPDGARA